MAHNMKFKPRLRRERLHGSDASAPDFFANGLAILTQTSLPQLRRLTGCYVDQRGVHGSL